MGGGWDGKWIPEALSHRDKNKEWKYIQDRLNGHVVQQHPRLWAWKAPVWLESAFTILKLLLLLHKRPLLPLIFLLHWALQMMQTVLNLQHCFFHSLNKTSMNSNVSCLYTTSVPSGRRKLKSCLEMKQSLGRLMDKQSFKAAGIWFFLERGLSAGNCLAPGDNQAIYSKPG